ncbi:hypothetical protein ERJ75_000116400 [Trypanosoma vivax]|nr:hypothetical protein ERJ75_000116600 [Trypanosoma vivax]KAH8619928.1 hypothetical protein ERJ75_000116400 [Trypanosoma vivax]
MAPACEADNVTTTRVLRGAWERARGKSALAWRDKVLGLWCVAGLHALASTCVREIGLDTRGLAGVRFGGKCVMGARRRRKASQRTPRTALDAKEAGEHQAVRSGRPVSRCLRHTCRVVPSIRTRWPTRCTVASESAPSVWRRQGQKPPLAEVPTKHGST